ncbi:hypothetical protein H0H81_011458 [Sphagnurus paluster]|uniref:Uncharacterized protein n=1 Tax=Sphagnurus paluster TaxID=117069 RepID=A0A9P7FV38_9AGAR|nr:hypothetical protein H0H81_011458 [Sphagnurus paluster]
MLHEATKLPGACLSFAHVEEIEVRARDKSTLLLATELFAESAASASLKRLVYDFRKDDCFTNIFFGTSIYNLDFFRLPPSLNKLHVEIPYENGPHFLGWLSAALQDGAEGGDPRPLKELVLVIRKECSPTSSTRQNSGTPWIHSALRSTMHSACRHTQRAVEVGSKYFYPPYDETRERLMVEDAIPVSYLSNAIERLYARLPRLRARGILRVRWLVTEKRQSGLEAAVRALREGIEGPVHADENERFKVGREYTESTIVEVHLRALERVRESCTS